MEIELKYRPEEGSGMPDLFQDPEVRPRRGRLLERQMEAVYFDTGDRVLSGRRAALRLRREGDQWMVTLKWGGSKSANGALSRRQELNVPVLDAEAAEDLPGLFEGTSGEEVFQGILPEDLLPTLRMDFLRTEAEVRAEDVAFVLSTDEGVILAGGKEAPIREAELELTAGDQEALVAFGRALAERNGLVPEPRSKLSRGLALLGE